MDAENGHFTSYIENGKLKIRFQQDGDEQNFVINNIQANKDYEVTASFGDGKVSVWLNDKLVAEGNLDMDWSSSDEFLQIGANGWASEAGQAGFRDVFDGTISDVYVFDSDLTPQQIDDVFLF